jgi:hypothetical protein
MDKALRAEWYSASLKTKLCNSFFHSYDTKQLFGRKMIHKQTNKSYKDFIQSGVEIDKLCYMVAVTLNDLSNLKNKLFHPLILGICKYLFV